VGQAVNLDGKTFEQAKKQKFAVIDFWAEWCGPCKVMGPLIEELAAELKGKVFFGKVNVDDNPELSEQNTIRAVPTMLFFSEGKLVGEVIGAVSKPALKKKILEEMS